MAHFPTGNMSKDDRGGAMMLPIQQRGNSDRFLLTHFQPLLALVYSEIKKH